MCSSWRQRVERVELVPGKSSLGQARVFINDVSVCQIKKNRSDFKPDPGGHRPRRPYAQGRTHTHTHIYIYICVRIYVCKVCVYDSVAVRVKYTGNSDGRDKCVNREWE